MIVLLKGTADACNMLMESFVVASVIYGDCKETFLKIILDENIILLAFYIASSMTI